MVGTFVVISESNSYVSSAVPSLTGVNLRLKLLNQRSVKLLLANGLTGGQYFISANIWTKCFEVVSCPLNYLLCFELNNVLKTTLNLKSFYTSYQF